MLLSKRRGEGGAKKEPRPPYEEWKEVLFLDVYGRPRAFPVCMVTPYLVVPSASVNMM